MKKGNVRKFIWKAIWLCSLGTLQITVIYKDGVVIKLDPIWCEVDEPDVGSSELDVGPNGLKDKVKLGCSPSTDVEYWDAR
jgi:hypothetical protein